MIMQGITELNSPFCDAYLRVASYYCEVVTKVESLNKVCGTVIDAIATLQQPSDETRAPSGENVLRFFKDISSLTNPHCSAADVTWRLVRGSDKFATPLLLYTDESVRNGAHEFIRDLYITYMEDPQNLEDAYGCIRVTASEVIKRIAYESGSGMLRSHLEPLLATGNFLVGLLYDLNASEDPDLDACKDDNDKALIYQWQIEVESRVRMLPEIGTPRSMGEGMIDQSDYGSESDDVELIDQ